MDEIKESTPQPPSSVSEELAAIRADVSAIRKQLDEQAQSQEAGDAPEKSDRKTSRLMITGGLGLVGMKLGGLLGMKVGLGRTALRLRKNGESIFQTLKEGLGRVKFDKMMEHSIKDAMVYGDIGSLIGGLVGGAFGWVRGHRVKDPKDILVHPIDTMRSLIVSDKTYAREQEEADAKKHQRKHLPETTWQDKVTESKSETRSRA